MLKSGSASNIQNLTNKANSMLNSAKRVFLNDISTRFVDNNFLYNARIMSKCTIYDSFLVPSNTGDAGGTADIVVCPVITLEQKTRLEKTNTGKWNVSI